MPGSPVRRQRKLAQMEADRLNGLEPTPHRFFVDTNDNTIAQEIDESELEVSLEELKKIEGAPKKGQHGASKEYMNALRKIRSEMAKVDPSRNGGRRKKPTRAEITELALERLEPMALRV